MGEGDTTHGRVTYDRKIVAAAFIEMQQVGSTVEKSYLRSILLQKVL